MLMSNVIDLRKKEEKKVKVVVKKVFKRRTLKAEFFLFVIITILATIITWGTSKADEFWGGDTNIPYDASR